MGQFSIARTGWRASLDPAQWSLTGGLWATSIRQNINDFRKHGHRAFIPQSFLRSVRVFSIAFRRIFFLFLCVDIRPYSLVVSCTKCKPGFALCNFSRPTAPAIITHGDLTVKDRYLHLTYPSAESPLPAAQMWFWLLELYVEWVAG